MWSAIDWAIAGCIIILVVWRVDKWVNRCLDNIRFQQEARDREATVALQERKNQADLDARSIEELAATRKADLQRQQAEHVANTHAIESTVDDRVEEERQVIAARTEQRVLLAKTQAMPSSSSDVSRLLDSYDTYVQRTGSMRTFEDWLGDLEIHDGRLNISSY